MMPKTSKISNGVKKLGKPDMVRSVKELKQVLHDQTWLKKAKNFNVYYVWRGVKEKNGLRYDITVIPPKMLGKEFPKTKGHKHLNNFQELITVLEGEAYYLSQFGKGNKIDKIEVIKAKKGDWIIYPPNSEHLTINPGKKRLVMANWISKKCKSDYSLFEKYQGAGYYYTKSGWLKNKNYKKMPKLHFQKPLKQKPKNLDFLYGS